MLKPQRVLLIFLSAVLVSCTGYRFQGSSRFEKAEDQRALNHAAKISLQQIVDQHELATKSLTISVSGFHADKSRDVIEQLLSELVQDVKVVDSGADLELTLKVYGVDYLTRNWLIVAQYFKDASVEVGYDYNGVTGVTTGHQRFKDWGITIPFLFSGTASE